MTTPTGRDEGDAHPAFRPDVDPAATATPAVPGGPVPDATRLGDVLASSRSRSVGVTVLAVLAVLYTLYFARAVLLPLTLALLLSFLFSPVTRGMARHHVPQPLGAGLVLVALLALLAGGVYALAVPAQHWIARAPQTLAAAGEKLRVLREPVERVTETAAQVERATSMSAPRAPTVVVAGESLAQRLFGTTSAMLTGLLQVVVTLYFLLAVGDLFLQKLIALLPTWTDKVTAVRVAREAESSISTYLVTLALVNVVEGLVVAGALWLLEVPNPLLWGVLAALLEFIPYLGGLVLTALLALVGLVTFDGVGQALLVPGSYVLINLLKEYVAAPLLLGDRLALNPVAIVVGLALFYFLWGIPGAFLAVPILATFKIVCDHVESLAAVGAFLSDRDPDERRRSVRVPAG